MLVLSTITSFSLLAYKQVLFQAMGELAGKVFTECRLGAAGERYTYGRLTYEFAMIEIGSNIEIDSNQSDASLVFARAGFVEKYFLMPAKIDVTNLSW